MFQDASKHYQYTIVVVVRARSLFPGQKSRFMDRLVEHGRDKGRFWPVILYICSFHQFDVNL